MFDFDRARHFRATRCLRTCMTNDGVNGADLPGIVAFYQPTLSLAAAKTRASSRAKRREPTDGEGKKKSGRTGGPPSGDNLFRPARCGSGADPSPTPLRWGFGMALIWPWRVFRAYTGRPQALSTQPWKTTRRIDQFRRRALSRWPISRLSRLVKSARMRQARRCEMIVL